MAASKSLMASLTHYRPITCSATASPTSLSSSSSSSSRLVPYPPDLIKWVKREGGFVHPSVRISEDGPYGLGLVASQQIPKGSPLIALPDHVPLKFGPDRDGLDGPTSVLAGLASHVPDELWSMKLALKLLHERAKVDSFWWPYISNLPETFSVPVFFQREDIEDLQYAPLVHQVKKRCRFLLDFDKLLKKALANVEPSYHPFAGKDVESSALGWAMSAVSSRAFRLYGEKLPDGSHVDSPMMLPLIDMCNHSFDPNSHIVQEKDAGKDNMLVTVVAETRIEENDPLLLNYGSLSNDLFLLDYGFVVPSNPNDCVELKYSLGLLEAAGYTVGVYSPNFSSPKPWQQKILSELQLIGEASNPKVILGGEEQVDGRLLAALRVLLATNEDAVNKVDLETLKSLSAFAPVGDEIELSALHIIVALVSNIFERMPTKPHDDDEILRQRIPDSTRLVVQYRIEKKKALSEVMRTLGVKVKALML